MDQMGHTLQDWDDCCLELRLSLQSMNSLCGTFCHLLFFFFPACVVAPSCEAVFADDVELKSAPKVVCIIFYFQGTAEIQRRVSLAIVAQYSEHLSAKASVLNLPAAFSIRENKAKPGTPKRTRVRKTSSEHTPRLLRFIRAHSCVCPAAHSRFHRFPYRIWIPLRASPACTYLHSSLPQESPSRAYPARAPIHRFP